MKKCFICLLGLALFILSGTVFAINWVYIWTEDNSDVGLGKSKVYIDVDNVVKNANDIIFWEYVLSDQSVEDNKGNMYKRDVQLTNPRKERCLACYMVDLNNNAQEVPVYSFEKDWSQVDPASNFDHEIDNALKYAKEGQDTGQIPDVSQLPH